MWPAHKHMSMLDVGYDTLAFIGPTLLSIDCVHEKLNVQCKTIVGHGIYHSTQHIFQSFVPLSVSQLKLVQASKTDELNSSLENIKTYMYFL